MKNPIDLPKSKLTGKPVLHFAHANGIPSRVYEALFEPLQGIFTIVYIPVLGRDENGDKSYPIDNHWKQLTQQIIDSVSQAKATHGVPVVGLGHSLGALTTLQAIYQRPELFARAVLMDPPLIYGRSSLMWHIAKLLSPRVLREKLGWSVADKMSPAGLSKHRRDVWASRDEARELLRSKSLFKSFDSRTFEAYIQYGLTEQAGGTVTLTIPKEVEVAVFRNNPSLYWLKPNRPPKTPVTLLIGKDSLFMTRGFPSLVQKRLSIPFETHRGGHMFPLEYPDSVAQKIISTLQS